MTSTRHTIRLRSLVVVLGLLILHLPSRPALAGFTWLETVIDGNTEYQFYRDGFHFSTIVQDALGRVGYRPHPDRFDENGWGTTLFFGPFVHDEDNPFAAGEPDVGTLDSIDVAVTAAGFDIAIAGDVSRAGGLRYGSWDWNASLGYNAAAQRVFADGALHVTLDGTLSAIGPKADLNLDRISSNFLRGVPLQTGITSNTGDMRNAIVRYATDPRPGDFLWSPAQSSNPDTSPQLESGYLSVDVVGERNLVDNGALRQGETIEIADKPTFSLAFESQAPDQDMIIALFYDEMKEMLFHEDNVGINHLIKRDNLSTEFWFDFSFAAVRPVLGDVNGDGLVDGADYTIWANDFALTGTEQRADLNHNGIVDGPDYPLWANDFGRTVPVLASELSPVPEPTGFILLGFGVLGVLAFRFPRS